ncbi:hypothetical protein C8J57DRAFT_1524350 [Mycena rebaudengoi]|nr:hypothetical protein C8J57DRAFT_1524350 [Mycena rebaudengoi]
MSERAARSAKRAASYSASEPDDSGAETAAPTLPSVPEVVEVSASVAIPTTDVDTAPVTTPPAQAAPALTSSPARIPAPNELGDPSTPTIAPTSIPPSTPSPRRGSFPPLPSPGVESMPSHAARRKNKGKGKGKAAAPRSPSPAAPASPAPPATTLNLFGDYDEEADLARAKALSLSNQAAPNATGASSSRRRDDSEPILDSPPKRQRADTTGRAVPRDTATPVPAPRGRARPNYFTEDANPPRGSFTPAPAHGFRHIYGMTAARLFRNHPNIQLGQWDEVEHPKIICTISGGNGDRVQTAQRLRDHIANRFNMTPSDVLIGSPGLADRSPDPKRSGPDPIAWLVAGLTLNQAQALLDLGVLCSDIITTFFHAYRPPISGYVGTFQGFTIHQDQEDLALRIIADAVAADPSIGRFIRAHRDAFPADMTADQAFEAFCESIGVGDIQLLSSIGPFTAWNVYIHSPTTNEDDFEALCRLFGNLVINTPFHGQGRIFHRPLHCNICLATDHPTNLCPFPNSPGWLGPTPETIGALLEISRDALNPNKKKPGRDAKKGNFDGKGKGKDRDDRKGGDRRRGNN